jgi:cell division protein FtsI/penicillin-binding protein 2
VTDMTRRGFLSASLLLATPPLEQAIPRDAVGAAVLQVDNGTVLAARGQSVLSLPGSTVKPFALLALLRSGRLPADERLPCPGRLRIGDRIFDCFHGPLPQPPDAVAALAYSCNHWFARMAERLDPVRFAQDIRQSELAPDAVPARTIPDLQLEALGEGHTRITAMSLARGYRRLAVLAQKKEPLLNPLFEGLRAAASYGTARLASPPGLEVAGKTGTGTRDGGPGRTAWFAGYAPAASPGVVVAIALGAGSGGADAAPRAAEIFEQWRRWRKAQ